jgi:putative phosphoesterase
MRFGLLGDVHAEDRLLERALRCFAEERVDLVLHVGDVVDGRGDVERCIELLAGAGAVGVRGNHERWLLQGRMRDLPDAHRLEALSSRARAEIEAWPATRTLETPLGPLLLCHGLGEDDMARLRPHDDGYAIATNDALLARIDAGTHALLVGGHTHERMVRRFEALTIVNAGTLAREGPPTASVLDCATRQVRVYDPSRADVPLLACVELPERGETLALGRMLR